MTDQTIHAVK